MEPTFPWLPASMRKDFYLSNAPPGFPSFFFPRGGMIHVAGGFALHHSCFLLEIGWKGHTPSLFHAVSFTGTAPLGENPTWLALPVAG